MLRALGHLNSPLAVCRRRRGPSHAVVACIHSLADGRLSREEFEREPGLVPVWCRFLHGLELIALCSVALDRIDAVL
ncbi:hypothetical protein GCM10022232_82100 [Streptomyces plumbiresistens]|uniref:Transposase n=1 Tax=Streptomyces plumbiresistens TaxID=511811 RepID=A0ABP7TCS6_9ACTN